MVLAVYSVGKRERTRERTRERSRERSREDCVSTEKGRGGEDEDPQTQQENRLAKSFSQLIEYLHNDEKRACEHYASCGESNHFEVTVFAE